MKSKGLKATVFEGETRLHRHDYIGVPLQVCEGKERDRGREGENRMQTGVYKNGSITFYSTLGF